MATSKSGVWFDTKTRKVVEKRPVEGFLLCAPGDEITPEVQSTIDEYRIADAPRETADLSAGAVETATVDKKTVTTGTAFKK